MAYTLKCFRICIETRLNVAAHVETEAEVTGSNIHLCEDLNIHLFRCSAFRGVSLFLVLLIVYSLETQSPWMPLSALSTLWRAAVVDPHMHWGLISTRRIFPRGAHFSFVLQAVNHNLSEFYWILAKEIRSAQKKSAIFYSLCELGPKDSEKFSVIVRV